MPDANLISQVQVLRERGLSPKAIAKALKIRPAEAQELIRASAEQRDAVAPISPLVGCWLSAGWSCGLRWKGHSDWPADPGSTSDEPMLAQVLVARKHRYGEVTVGGFLVDAACLGVKAAMKPRQVEETELPQVVEMAFSAFDDGCRQVPLDLAQHLVLGAVDYARRLGFEPDPDYERCRPLLGEFTGPSEIEFGFLGKPYFVAGPRDDVQEIMATLRRTVGDKKFEFLVPVGLG